MKIQTVEVRIYKAHKDAVIPSRAHDADACYDLICPTKVSVSPNGIAKVSTGLVMAIPKGWEGVIRPRSGITSVKGVYTFGTVDAGYRGEVKVIIDNSTPLWYTIYPGDKIAQLAIREVPNVIFNEVDNLDDLPNIDSRGTGGFGSTDK